jgi:transcriptional regulator with PAS, ATPase and Fis domain
MPSALGGAQVNETQQEARPVEPLEAGTPFEGLIGSSRPMKEVFRLTERVANTSSTILLLGETGTGKGKLARAIHQLSDRRQKPLVQINCGAIPETLLESELFGYVKGAFTGAAAAKTGKFEMAEGGTVFLDEIGDMSLDLQVKILRVLEEREFEPVGGLRTVKVNVRIIAATHRDLEEKVQNGAFREDLYYRLNVIPITLPPLVDRPEDIPLLIDYFLKSLSGEQGQPQPWFTEQAQALLRGYRWPGNVRELKNLIEQMVVLHGHGPISPAHLPAKFTHSCTLTPPAGNAPSLVFSDEGVDLTAAVSHFEKSLIYQSLEKARWVKKEAARLLNVKRTTLVEKIKRYDLQRAG